MPESDVVIDGEGGKRVTITIAELTDTSSDTDTGSDPNTFVIYNDKYRLTITIAE